MFRHHFMAAVILAASCLPAGCGGTQDPTRAAAQGVLDTGGKVLVRANGQSAWLGADSSWPEGEAVVIGVTWTDYPGDRAESVTDSVVETLVQLPALVELDLSGTNITDAALPWVAKLKNLKRLRLIDCPIGDTGFALLSGLPLEDISLGGTRVSDKAVKAFKVARPKCIVRR